ncbi:MAG: Panacea domain-containing protein [Acidimicrobiales bacterium]
MAVYDKIRIAVDQWEYADEEKLAELILYVASKIRDDPTGGATKINKILYFSEFAHVRGHGVPITGVSYQKLPQGPAPRRLRPIRDRLIEQGAAELQRDDYFGYRLDRLVPLRDVDMSKLAPSEVQIVDQVVEALRGKTAQEASELSHKDKAWQLVEMYDDRPLSTAYLAPRSVVTDASRRHATVLAEKLGLSG